MRINIQNVEDLIFHDKEIWKSIPDLVHLRDQWRISKMAPALRAMGRKAMLDFLSSAKSRHEDALSERFGQRVTIDRLDTSLVRSVEFSCSEDFPEIVPDESYTGFSTHRKGDTVSLTFWR